MPTPWLFGITTNLHWHKAGVDAKRSAAIIEAAQRANVLERLSALPADSEMSRRLQPIPGVWPLRTIAITDRGS